MRNKFLVMLIFILALNLVSSLSITTFNNSLTNENMTFLGNENITRYLKIPQNNVLTSAYLNISSYNYSYNFAKNLEYYISNVGSTLSSIGHNNSNIFAFDETSNLVYVYDFGLNQIANISIAGSDDINHGITSNGSVIWTVKSNISGDYIIERGMDFSILNGFTLPYGTDLNSRGIANNLTNVFFANYNRTIYILNLTGGQVGGFSALGQISSGGIGGIDINGNSIYISDLNTNIAYIYNIDGTYTGNYTNFGAINNTGLENDITIINNSLYLVAHTGVGYTDIIKAFGLSNQIFNPWLSIGNANVWNFTGTFSQYNNKTLDLTIPINNYLSTCIIIDGNCTLPFTFHSDFYGIMQYLDLRFDGGSIGELTHSYNATTYETATESYIYNFFISPIILSKQVNFYYNNVSHTALVTCDGTNCTAISSMDVPLITNGHNQQNNSLYWMVTGFDGSTSYSQNSTLYEQGVNQLGISLCNTGTVAFNYTLYDEQNLTRINNFKLDATFDFWTGTGAIHKQINITNTSNEVDICISQNQTFYADAIIAYNIPSASSTYTIRNLFYQGKQFNNSMQNVELLTLLSSKSTSFILEVKNKYLLPVPLVLLNVLRYYPATNEYRTAFIARTDSNGQTVGNFEAEDALYSILITNYSDLLLNVSMQKVVPGSAPYTLTFQIGSSFSTTWESLQNLSDLSYSLYYNKTNNIVSFTYIDTSGKFQISRLYVAKMNMSGKDATVCNTTSLLSAATLTCNVTNVGGGYSATAYITRDGDPLIDQIVFAVQTFTSSLGLYGVFIGFFIVLICAFAFKWNEIAGIWLTVICMIFINFIGLINFGWVGITALLLVAVTITAILER